MSVEIINQPFPHFTDDSGEELDRGYIYIGEAGADPESNPITVYWDSAKTIPAVQPLRVFNGNISRSGSSTGSPSRVWVGSDYSIKTKDKSGGVVYSSLSENAATETLDSSQIIFSPAGTGAVARTVEAEIRDLAVNVNQYGATGDGVTDDTAAIALAINAACALNKFLYAPSGSYLTNTIEIKLGMSGILGDGSLGQSADAGTRFLIKTNGDNLFENNTGTRLNNLVFKDFVCDSASGVKGGIAIYAKSLNSCSFYNVAVKREVGTGYEQALKVETPSAGLGAYYNNFFGCRFRQAATVTSACIEITSPTGDVASETQFFGGQVQAYGAANTAPAFLLNRANGTGIYGVAIEGGYENAIVGTSDATYQTSLHCHGCRFETSSGTKVMVDFDADTKQCEVIPGFVSGTWTVSDLGEFNTIENKETRSIKRIHQIVKGSNCAFVGYAGSGTPTVEADSVFEAINSSGVQKWRIRNNGDMELQDGSVVITGISTGVAGNTSGVLRLRIEAASTGSRPTGSLGMMFFDTTLGIPIWYDGTNWVDATGATV